MISSIGNTNLKLIYFFNNYNFSGELKFGTDESTFNMILCSRSFCQLQQVFLEYHRLTGRDFEDVIKSEFSGDIENGLKAVGINFIDANFNINIYIYFYIW